MSTLVSELVELCAGEVTGVVSEVGAMDSLHPGEVEEEDDKENASERDNAPNGFIHGFPLVVSRGVSRFRVLAVASLLRGWRGLAFLSHGVGVLCRWAGTVAG